MISLFDLQRWLYAGIASNLDEVGTCNLWALVCAMAGAMVCGAVHALMPAHGKATICGKDC